MNINRLKSIILATIIAFILLNTSCDSNNNTIKIGAIIPLSGAASHLVDVRDAMNLAVQEVNSLGGINGKKIEFIVEDSKSDKDEAQKVFYEIEEKHKPLFFM